VRRAAHFWSSAAAAPLAAALALATSVFLGSSATEPDACFLGEGERRRGERERDGERERRGERERERVRRDDLRGDLERERVRRRGDGERRRGEGERRRGDGTRYCMTGCGIMGAPARITEPGMAPERRYSSCAPVA
jgi:hypothetical protein